MPRSSDARLAGWRRLSHRRHGESCLRPPDADGERAVDVRRPFLVPVLGVTLYAITRVQDADLALLGLARRIVEAVPGGEGVGALFFAVGSAIFSWLLLKGRMVPPVLARLGVFASLLLVASLLMRRAGLFAAAVNWSSPATWSPWLAMLVFEIALALWFLIEGVAAPAEKPS